MHCWESETVLCLWAVRPDTLHYMFLTTGQDWYKCLNYSLANSVLPSLGLFCFGFFYHRSQYPYGIFVKQVAPPPMKKHTLSNLIVFSRCWGFILFSMQPDPAFYVSLDPDPGGFDELNMKMVQLKKFLFLSIGLQEGHPSYRRSLQPALKR